ncbi:Protein-L-isoaspartate O-methyltransferase [Actinomadura rubteroloni]|uniref:Protein-L-isoaspartate O-methyltransferase n=1 Tax=Actinomadura rubteroloni TaxID=1926885 RepID=A0A2P4UQZ4_9ACTN|nr:methyltransferase domain-containing protein [Actinomadura rubteroloni]POM27472.1 Protein-L-isoaspartate O-methyltransferase [Actinomadura rubteroloni]
MGKHSKPATSADNGDVIPDRVWRRMLDALDLEPGMSVLEIGTGTGHTAALLAEAGALVTTVETVPELAAAASAALPRADVADRITVITGPLEKGAPDHAPFDRVISTTGAHTIPPAWIEQTKEGGRIVVPYTGPEYPGALLALTVAEGTATGGATTAAHPQRGKHLKTRHPAPAGPLNRLHMTATPTSQTITFT